MNKVNFNQTGGFPLTTNVLSAMQQAYSIFNAIADMSGNLAILKGCTITGNHVADGVVAINGEVLPFKGGLQGSKVTIIESTEKRPFEDGNEREVFVKRVVQFSSAGKWNWSDFIKINPLQEIQKAVVPVGIISMWSGAIADIPQGWVLCNGTHGTPNLRDRFIIGAGGAYNIGATGGQSEVILSESQMPLHSHSGKTGNAGSHKHTGSTYSGGSHSHPYVDGYYIESGTPSQDSLSGYHSEQIGTGFQGSEGLDSNNNYIWCKDRNTNSGGSHSHSLNMNNAGEHSHSFKTEKTGGTTAHENKPPYYALAYIMFTNK